MLAITALAAIIALVISNSPRQTSVLAQQFKPTAILTQILKDENLKGTVIMTSGGGDSSSSAYSRNFLVTFDSVSNADVRAKVMQAFSDHIRKSIEDQGYKVGPSNFSGTSKAEDFKTWRSLNKFIYNYKGPKIRGRVRVFASYDGHGRPKLTITVDEY